MDILQCGLGLGWYMWCFGSVFGQVCCPPDTKSQRKLLCLLACACCDAINSYHLFPLRLRARSNKLNVASLLSLLKPQEDLHMWLTLNKFSSSSQKNKGEEPGTLCADKETDESRKGTSNAAVLYREENGAQGHLDARGRCSGSTEYLLSEKPPEDIHFQPMLQSKIAQLQGLTSE